MKPFALSITQSLCIVVCYLSLAAHLTSAIWSIDRPKSRNKVSVAATERGTKQNVGLIDEAMKVLGLDEFFSIYDTDNDDDDDDGDGDGDESDEYKVKHSNTKGHSDDSTNEYSTSNKKRTRNNSSNNNSTSKGEQDILYSDIESALEQASDKVESLWLQFKQSVHRLMPDLSHHGIGNDGEEQIEQIQTKPTTGKIETTTTERPIPTKNTRQIETATKESTITTTTEKPPITIATTTAVKIITDNPLTNAATESSNAPSEETTIEQRKIEEVPPSSENLDSQK